MTANVNKYPKLTEVANDLGVKPFWLWLVIQSESKWNPFALNPISGAIGLIQFMPSTALSLGTTSGRIALMGVDPQLDLVYQYMLPYKRKIKNIYDTYLAVFYPYAIGKNDNYIFGSEKSMNYAKTIAKQNPAISGSGSVITMKDFKNYVRAKAKAFGYKPSEDFLFLLKKSFTI